MVYTPLNCELLDLQKQITDIQQQLLLHPFNGLFSRTTWVSWYRKGKTSLDLNGARDDGVLGCSGISWTICKQSAPCSRQITTPTPHHSIFTGRMLFLTPNQQCQSTEGNHKRTIKNFSQSKVSEIRPDWVDVFAVCHRRVHDKWRFSSCSHHDVPD